MVRVEVVHTVYNDAVVRLLAGSSNNDNSRCYTYYKRVDVAISERKRPDIVGI